MVIFTNVYVLVDDDRLKPISSLFKFKDATSAIKMR